MSRDMFRIRGRVTESESGLGVPGLVVRACDKDLLYDDLLGTAATGAEGGFELLRSPSGAGQAGFTRLSSGNKTPTVRPVLPSAPSRPLEYPD